jgi:hypothetical protein
MSEIEQQAAKSYYSVWVFDYETEMWRAVAGFETQDEAIDLADNSWDGRLMDACLAIDRCFTLGGYEVRKYNGEVVCSLH